MSCSYCFGTGNVMARLKNSEIFTPFAFVCACYSARRRSFPLWNKDRLKEYEVLEQQQPSYEPGPRRPTLLPPVREIPRT